MAVSTASYIAQRSKEDVQAVVEEAQHLLRLTSNGIEYRLKESGKLPIIAIIGPGLDCQTNPDCNVSLAVLCEIGLRHATPYAKSQFGYRRDCLPFFKPIYLRERKKLFCLSKPQYLEVAPQLFRLMQRLTNEQVGARRSGGPSDPFYRTNTELYVRRACGEIRDQTWKKPFVRGIRFHIDLRDELLVSDLCRVALTYDLQGIHERVGLRKFIRRCLDGYSRRHSFRRFSQLKYAAVAFEAIHRPSLARHQLVHVLEGLRKYPHFEHLAQAADYGGEWTPVHLHAKQGLAGLKYRLNAVTEMTPRRKQDPGLYQFQAQVVALNGHLDIECRPNQEAWDLLEAPVPDPDPTNELWLEFALESDGLEFDECPF
ncbi:MAG: hypothetical protein KBB55_03680 [Candidatus Buchananbacteria bacterium]|nr:hypothetical protein [Candidatus Buchananbacteria bacterium]